MSAEQAIVGVDIGGTNTVIGVFDQSLALHAKYSMPTCANLSTEPTDYPQLFFDRLAGVIQKLVRESSFGGEIMRVGMGVPGRVDPEQGAALRASNLGWRNVPFADQMSVRLGAPVVIDNDVRMYMLGESFAGAGKGYQNIVCVTLGTGMAAGVMIEGKVLRGSSFNAGEIGHDPVEGIDFPCNCGKTGCLETIVSATGIARLAREAVNTGEATSLAKLPNTDRISSFDVYQACVNGDRTAKEIFHFVGTTLAHKLLTVMLLVDPEIVIIGGGAASAGPLLLDPILSFIQRHYLQRESKPIVRIGQLGDEAGLIGAAYYAVSTTP